MKIAILNLFIYLLVSILFSGCSGGSNKTDTLVTAGNVDDIYYGKWVYAENSDELNIDTTTTLNPNYAIGI
ncbi:MAG: hypothetical protein U9P72_09555, partial [Campylobacterota bacterium]|nr:hypothetical protein [Campylobacterota bacterium]